MDELVDTLIRRGYPKLKRQPQLPIDGHSPHPKGEVVESVDDQTGWPKDYRLYLPNWSIGGFDPKGSNLVYSNQ